ncbi:hypothetical protein ACQ1PF_07875 [Ornithobacterium rhinotracheale]
MKNLYEILTGIESDLRVAYKCGGRVPCELLRDIDLYRDYLVLRGSGRAKMVVYSELSERYKISDSIVRQVVRTMGAKAEKN